MHSTRGLALCVLLRMLHDASSSGDNNDVTIVTGYWKVSSKHTHSSYDEWFRTTLAISAPTVVYYSSPEVREVFEMHRAAAVPPASTTYERVSGPEAFGVTYGEHWTHAVHVPTDDVGRIWISKPAMMNRAANVNVYNTSWFAWVDAGITPYRHAPPPAERWPREDLLRSLPIDKVIYSGTHDSYHDFAGTAFMYHGSIAALVLQRFGETLERCRSEIDDWRCGNDQYLFTQMREAHPDMFHRIGNGYGAVVVMLFGRECRDLICD